MNEVSGKKATSNSRNKRGVLVSHVDEDMLHVCAAGYAWLSII